MVDSVYMVSWTIPTIGIRVISYEEWRDESVMNPQVGPLIDKMTIINSKLYPVIDSRLFADNLAADDVCPSILLPAKQVKGDK